MRNRNLLLILCCLARFTFAQSLVQSKVALGERAFTASKIYSLLQLYFSGWKTLPELDPDIAYRNYLEKALASDDRRLFDLTTMEFVARLRNGHTVFSDSWLTQNYGQPMGFYARPLEGKWVVESSAVQGLKPGDVLSMIDDTDLETFFRQQQKYISGSSEAGQRHNFFFLSYLFPQQFTLALVDGRTVTVARAGNKPPSIKTIPEGRWIKQDAVAYIRIPSFANLSSEEKSLAFVVQFQKAKTLIIDVRNNPGGLSQRRLVDALMDSTYHNWKESTPIHISLFDYYGQTYKGQQPKSKEITDFERGFMSSFDLFGDSQLIWGGERILPRAPVFHGQMIFLVDGGCASACEDLLEPFKESGRGTLIGETTEGTSGPGYSHDFGNGMTLGIAIKRRYFPDGSEFEGIGIKPDIEIHSSVQDLKDGKDPVLDKAVELIEKASP